ncbi:uncharacterized protein LOC116418448 [Piliocolobus tephrosceles]|uniref:uncharacterized protein LOC116418448 n=1 Tax=Piliocolobus tephrosceles TaxID=591936 RepID=UPI001300FF66|nr:uncharacterized protein LOC116418448 [Piliocolobus tephrosceles]
MLPGPKSPVRSPHLSPGFFHRAQALEGRGCMGEKKAGIPRGERPPSAHARPPPQPAAQRLQPRPPRLPGGPRPLLRYSQEQGHRGGGGASPRRPLTCRGRGRRRCGCWPVAFTRVHASHLRHQLPQRRLNGPESQPRRRCRRRSCAAPARLPLGAR